MGFTRKSVRQQLHNLASQNANQQKYSMQLQQSQQFRNILSIFIFTTEIIQYFGIILIKIIIKNINSLILTIIIFGYLIIFIKTLHWIPTADGLAVPASTSTSQIRNYIENHVFDVPTASASASGSNLQLQQPISSGCPRSVDSNCLRCNIEGCIKCPEFLIQDSRLCTKNCPSGYIDQWSSSPEFMGRICIAQSLSAPLLAAITGLIAGFFVCFTLLIVSIILIKRKRRRITIKKKLINENVMDRSDFLKQLDDMRPNAEYFLAMLNDTRRQIRKLYLSGEITAANSYRPIVRDLAKILILLNRPIELIPAPPHDWNRIYNWSEQALDRYKPKIGQLIDFFQGPPTNNFDYHHQQLHQQQQHQNGLHYSHQMNFSNSNNNTNELSQNNSFTNHHHHNPQHQHPQQQKIQLFGSLISLHEFDEPHSSDPFGSSFNTLKGNLISDLNASSLWLEDEFFKLGFRPQDEITTEL